MTLTLCMIVFLSGLLLVPSNVRSAHFDKMIEQTDTNKQTSELECMLTDANELYEIASKYALKKDYEKAIEYFEKSLRNNPDHRCANNGFAWLLLTCDDLKYRDLKRSVVLAEKAVSGDGFSCGPCWDTLGLASYQSGNKLKAHMAYLKSMALSGNSDEDGLNNYINYLSQEKTSESLERIDLVQSLKTKTNVLDLYKEANRLLIEEKKLWDALDFFTVALLISPAHPKANIIHFSRANAWYMVREDNMVLFDTGKAIAKSKGFAEAYELRGRVFGRNGIKEKALANYDRAVALSPSNDGILYNRGVAHLMMDNFQMAVADFTEAIRISPALPNLFFKRAFAYKEMEDYESAINDLKKALKIDPNYEKARLMLEAIMKKNSLQNN